MSGYDYKTERKRLFTEAGQREFLAVRDHVKRLLQEAGAFTMDRAFSVQNGPADTWSTLACVDRLVELGEILEADRGPCCAQDRVFVAPLRPQR